MSDESRRARFEQLVLVHMDDAYGLAIWLTRDESQAEDAVQEAYLRAFRYFGSFRGSDARPWLLGIVRNTCYTLLGGEVASASSSEFHEDSHDEESVAAGAVVNFPINPETAAIESADRVLLQQCLRSLSAEYREALVLRELQDCSYKEIAQIAEIPIGTVMSRLARGRRLLRRAMSDKIGQRSTGT